MTTIKQELIEEVAKEAKKLEKSEDAQGNRIMSSYTFKDCVEFEAGRVITNKGLDISQDKLVQEVIDYCS